MNTQDLLHLAALLHDIGKFRKRASNDNIPHPEHSYTFVNEDFSDFFSECGDALKNAIRNHHTNGENLMEKLVILADKLSATESEGEEQEATPLVPILSRLKDAKNTDKTYGYIPTALSFDRDTVIPTDSVEINQNAYETLWNKFTKEFSIATKDKHYSPAHYQTIVALLHKYTSRMPSETANPADADISLYDHLRTAAAIAACVSRVLTDEKDVDELIANSKESDRNICMLIKGDISGIQSFLYQILSDGAARRLRGRSFYLQLLTEAIAHWVLKQLDLPITNLLLASGGHFFILAPYTEAKDKFDRIRRQISEKLWDLHQNDLYCILDYADVKASDFTTQNFANKWGEVSENVHQRKHKKWSELGNKDMFKNLFEPHGDKAAWDFRELGKDLRNAKYLIAFEVPDEVHIPAKPNWHTAIKSFGWDIRIRETDDKSNKPDQCEHAAVYRIGKTDFLADNIGQNFQWDGISTSYDFRIFRPVIAHTDDDETADYSTIADASDGVPWLGTLRMDIDNLGTVFTEKLQNATISRLATLSESMRLFFEGYVPELCDNYNKNKAQILELIYAGGDDLFLVGGWSALPIVAEQIRSNFRQFVTGDHVTLSGGIAIEHQKFPLYQFAALSSEAEGAAKGIDDDKNAITFLRKPMKWEDFAEVYEWHHKFVDAFTGDKPLPHDILTRLGHIYSEGEQTDHQTVWRSLYYFYQLLERNKSQSQFIRELQNKLSQPKQMNLSDYIHVITRWTALRIRE